MKKQWNCFDWLRVIAMFLVMWPHLGYNLNPNWNVAGLVQRYITIPLGIVDNFGFMGVCIFFLITGFLLVNEDSPKCFLLKRLTKVFLTYWMTMVIFFFVQKVIEIAIIPTYWSQFSLYDWVKSIFLYNYFSGEQELVNGVIWYLVVVLLLYFLEFVRKSLKCAIAVSIPLIDIVFIIGFITMEPREYPILFFAPYISIAFTGILISEWLKHLQTTKIFILQMILNYMCLIVGFLNFLLEHYETGYLTSYVYALLIFVLFIIMEDKLNECNGIVKKLSDISYSFYLTHSLYGGMIISFSVMLGLPYTIGFILGVCVSIVVSFINYNIVEKNVSKILKCYSKR